MAVSDWFNTLAAQLNQGISIKTLRSTFLSLFAVLGKEIDHGGLFIWKIISGSRLDCGLMSSAKVPLRAGDHVAARPQHYPPLVVVFSLCALSHLLAAVYAPISDCDEVFNYWEPLHYLNRGYGLQTWEYSPEFALRSWLYIVLHAIPAKLGSLLSSAKSFEFYFLRCVLAVTCAATETRLFAVISRSPTLGPRIAILYLTIVAFSPGMFQASVALLPSTFTMFTSSLGLAAFIDWRKGPRTAVGIMWFGIGAILGWPFSGILVIPFILEEVVICVVSGQGYDTFCRFLDGAVRSFIALALQCAIDAFFYHDFVIVPLRLMLYNVLSGSDRGPNIFGTEPWQYYSQNLLLNFNMWYLLALGVAPLLFLQYMFGSRAPTKGISLRKVIFVMPFYIWVAIFTLQPHKEERFMFPIYPFLALNAAIAFHMILVFLGSSHPRGWVAMIPVKVKFAAVLITVILSLNVGILRTIGTVTAYRAPLQVYRALETQGMSRPGDNVCLGKEWYRFPSSYHLPNGTRARFVRSEFSGLLPGEFNEARVGFGLFPGTWLIPAGMNDRNEGDPGKYVNIAHCKYLVDSYMPEAKATDREPHYITDTETWEKVSCAPFLDTARTSLIARTLWIPTLDIIPTEFQRRWGEYCLLRRRR